MSLLLDNIYYSVNAAAANRFVLCLYHYSYERLCAALTDEYSSAVAKLCCYLVHLCTYIGICLCSSLVLDLYVFKYLWIYNEWSCKLAELLLTGHDDLHYFKAGEYTVACRSILGEDDMSALLAADAAAVLLHVLINVLVAYSSLCVVNTYLVKGSVKTEVGHNCSNDCIVEETSALLHVSSVYVEDMVACDDIALFVNAEAAVSVSVICKTNVKTVLNYELLESLDMC